MKNKLALSEKRKIAWSWSCSCRWLWDRASTHLWNCESVIKISCSWKNNEIFFPYLFQNNSLFTFQTATNAVETKQEEKPQQIKISLKLMENMLDVLPISNSEIIAAKNRWFWWDVSLYLVSWNYGTLVNFFRFNFPKYELQDCQIWEERKGKSNAWRGTS